MDVVVGVDGGGSKTACRVAGADGSPLGEATAGPSNYQTAGEAGVTAALAQAIGGAVAGVGAPVRVEGMCLALAGVDRPDDVAALRRVVGSLFARPPAGLTWGLAPERVLIVNDAQAALMGGTGRPYGVVCVAGTGSIVFGMNRHARQARAGGWGHLLGDEGSAYAVALAGLRAVCRAADGRGPETALTALVLDRLGLAAATGLIGLAYGGWSPPDVAALAPLVGIAAGAADAVARDILDGAAAELALATVTVARRLDLGTPEDGEGGFEVVTAGGLWTGLPALREGFAGALERLAPGATVIAPRDSPVGGAVRLALRAAAGAV